jgi:hypothetical protein
MENTFWSGALALNVRGQLNLTHCGHQEVTHLPGC